ncbi:MAG: hypothetical protein ACOZF2_12615 [Thermodesulfobacteriota bacterium]
MGKFNTVCPDHYPMKCNLSPADKDYLLTPEKYNAFLIFQYRQQDSWLEPTIVRYFSERTWRLYNAGKEGGTGTKFCNVCRYALAADFGVVSLTPLNYNVFQEIGLMQGLQKPLLYLFNPDHKKDLPFDMDDQIYIEHTDSITLEQGLSKKIPLLADKLRLITGFETKQKELVKTKLKELSPQAIDLLKRIILEGSFRLGLRELIDWVQENKWEVSRLRELQSKRFIVSRKESGGSMTLDYSELNEEYRKYLEELLFV